MASDGAPMPSSSISSTRRDSDIATKLQNTTILTIQGLQEITDGFSEQRKIGQGAYGKVYLAKFKNGEEIAVKVLYNNTPGIDDEQFQREFGNLMRLEHQNIVRLVGYCYETQHQPMQYKGRTIFTERTYRALCFEYMQNGSLEKHLSDECDGLDWITRYKIIRGAWMGLKYLHEGFREPIYHLDLKPDNILLDKNMLPKLADFGLSKLFGDKQTLTTHSPMGTIGYLPMEFIHGNIISNKYDIFSLGVVMIKIIAGRGGYSRSVEMPRQEFIDLVLENWRNRMSKTCQVSRPLEAYCKQVNTCTEIALGCMDIDRQKRPKIADIVHRLNETEAMINEAMASWRECTPSLMNESLVKLEVLTKTEEIPYANMDDEYPILVRFTALPWRHDEEMSHPSVDLVVVINGSQSLKDRTKEAMITVINSLGSNDRLSIVSVSRDYIMELTYMTDKGRNFARHMVDRMVGEVVGGQVVSVGILELSLEKGDKLLRGRQVKEGDSRVGFILVLFILLRDDDTPKPETSSEFPVHVLDLDMDYLDDMDHCRGNHEVLRYIADQNYGTYSFIQSDIKDALELFMGGITNVAATSIDITLKAHEGVAISSIDSGGYSSHVNSEGRSGAIHINDIYAGETKNFIVNLKLAEGKGKLVTVGGQYRSQNASKQLLAETDVFILRPHIRFSRKLLDMHPEVAAELVRLKLVKGIWSRAHPTMYNLAVISQYIGFSEEGQCAPKQALVGLVKDLEGLLKQRAHSVYSGQAYILSWLSCHKWQRATTKGSCSSDAFMRKC